MGSSIRSITGCSSTDAMIRIGFPHLGALRFIARIIHE